MFCNNRHLTGRVKEGGNGKGNLKPVFPQGTTSGLLNIQCGRIPAIQIPLFREAKNKVCYAFTVEPNNVW